MEEIFVDVVVGGTGEVSPVHYQRTRVKRCLHRFWFVDVLHFSAHAPPGGAEHGAFKTELF